MSLPPWFAGAAAALAMAPAMVPAMVPATAASAATISFSGTGTVDRATGRLTTSGTVPVGSTLSFAFSFDPAAASLYEADDGYALYDLPVSDFSATLGSYRFALSSDPLLVPAVAIGRGFSFFGGSSSEPSLGITFYFAGVTTTASSVTPFILSPGSRDALSFTAIFKADPTDTSVDIDQLRDPAGAEARNFVYSAQDIVSKRGGTLQGRYSGGFQTAAAVPEPSGWATMTLGFGVLGGALRGRRRYARITRSSRAA